jgi:protein-S-isoprenylcysteine O-methyltransferase Ste14
MKLAIQLGLYLAGLSLDVAILAVLCRGQWRRYPFVFLYVIGDFLTTVAEIPFGTGLWTADPNSPLAELYWIDERISQVLIFLLVISLVYRATFNWKPRRTLLLGVISVTLLFWAVSFLMHFNRNIATGQWMTPWMRDMNFCAVLLDLGLWGVLLRAREKDYKLLLVTGALGIQFTGNAIGEALRQLSHSMAGVTAYLIVFANLGCAYIWWRAFQMPDKQPARRRASVPAASARSEKILPT